jgi:hypothetical protein
VTKTYREGQVINVDVIFAQNHLGRMNVRLCPLDAKDEAQCRTLERCAGGVGAGERAAGCQGARGHAAAAAAAADGGPKAAATRAPPDPAARTIPPA